MQTAELTHDIYAAVLETIESDPGVSHSQGIAVVAAYAARLAILLADTDPDGLDCLIDELTDRCERAALGVELLPVDELCG